MNEKTLGSLWRFLGFSVLILVPSFDTVSKYAGIPGIIIYALAGTLALAVWSKYFIPLVFSKVSERYADIFALFTFIVLIGVVAYMYPLANSGRFGPGSDADDALVIGGSELLLGHYPYYKLTYLGGPISPMPGAILFAIPFVFAGAIYLQNIFWLAVLYLAFRTYDKNITALTLIWTILIFSPTVLQNLVTAGDYLSNSTYILLLMWWLVRSPSRSEAINWRGFVAAILLGVGLSSRSNFLLLTPLLLSVLAQKAGWKRALLYFGVCACTFIAVTVPFWLYDPIGFTPLTVQTGKMSMLQTVLPFSTIAIPAAGLLLAVFLSLQRMNGRYDVFFLSCAIVQFCVLLIASTAYSVGIGSLNFFVGQSGYGIFTFVFGVCAFWMNRIAADSSPVSGLPKMQC